jgi:hypothetical protein
MGTAAYAICFQTRWDTSGITGVKIVLLSGAVAIGVLVYGVSCYLLRSDEIHSAVGLLKKKLGRKNS